MRLDGFTKNVLWLFIREDSENIKEIPDKKEYDFFVGVYVDLLRDGQWPVVGNIPFENEDDAWRPPTYMKDTFTGKFSIYFHGEVSPSSEQQCKGLELTAVWDRHHVVDRLMGKGDVAYLPLN